jgi:hypothetical protein
MSDNEDEIQYTETDAYNAGVDDAINGNSMDAANHGYTNETDVRNYERGYKDKQAVSSSMKNKGGRKQRKNKSRKNRKSSKKTMKKSRRK